ncbi:restriction endonuclease [Candidatus Manganitrophus noduliformans]|uniref:Restriction endonuclease n=1 Tax=Candidatus Manganitrophus noduliformans TaxID=2606439 RepID=A0A7X6DU23_9BACT|nr:restriction endonuclease [Candidatus Manganitrophus noduliformans]NKE73407.1 restriction endonuclease [Candidatus Manganitrophus noduliformans]
MNKSLAEYLQSLSETDLYPLIRDLLRVMGYKQVTITHGPLEVGRDLVFLESDPIGRHIWRGVQVKTDSLTGSLATEKGARAVINQCEAALDTPYTDPNGQEVGLFEVWLVSPYPVSDFAKLSIKGKQKIGSKVHIIEGPRLCDLVEEFIPDLIESGSKPIEKYLRALIAFCDSPEEYLSTKMKMTYSISDIFIDPLVAIELIKGDSLFKKEPLSKVMRCEELKSSLNFVIPLLRESLLPAVEFYFMSEQIKNLSKLSKALSSIAWYKESSSTFREALQPLLFIIGINEKDEHSASRTQSSEKSFASCMEYEILEEFEGELCCLTHPEVEILKTYANLNKLRPNSVRQKGNSLDEELWVKAESGRGQFLIRLLDAYKGSIDQLSSMNQVVTHVRKLIYEKKLKNKKMYEEEIKSAHDSITKVIGFLDQFDSELRQRYKALYSEISNIHMQPDITTLHHEIRTVTELGQITSFTDAFYGKTSEEDYNCK